MKAKILLLTAIACVQASYAGELLGISRARGLPDYQKTALITTAGTGPHLHPVFDLGDMNEDGKLDLVIFEMDGPDMPEPDSNPVQALAAVYLQKDGQLVRVPKAPILPVSNVPRSFRLADFNEDGHLDLLFNDRGIGLLLVLGQGDGTFQQPTTLDLNALAFPAIADLNGDKHIDIVAATSENAAMVFLGRGDGTFSDGVTLDTLTNPVGQPRGQIMIGDVNRDSKPDIVVASVINTTTTDVGNLDVFIGHGDATFSDPIRNPNVGVWRGAIGDFNGDGYLDYAGTRYGPETIEIWLGTGDGHFTSRGSYSLSGYLPGWITLGDLNSDGLIDIISSNLTADQKPAPLAIFLGKGDGTFQPRKLHYHVDGLGQADFVPNLVDFNQDGSVDILAVAHSSDWVSDIFTVDLSQGSKLDPSLGFQLTLQNTANRSILLECSADLAAWTPLATNTPAGDWSLIHRQAASTQQFYRTRQP